MVHNTLTGAHTALNPFLAVLKTVLRTYRIGNIFKVDNGSTDSAKPVEARSGTTTFIGWPGLAEHVHTRSPSSSTSGGVPQRKPAPEKPVHQGTTHYSQQQCLQ